MMEHNTAACENILSAKEHRTHVDGTFYEYPAHFPCVLHDKYGCILITEPFYSQLVQMDVIRESMGGKKPKINIKRGIASINSYNRCPMKESCPGYRPKISAKK